MAYTAFTGKIIKHRYGAAKLTLQAACEVGQMLSAAGFLSDSQNARSAVWVACQKGAIGDEIWVALAVEIMKPPTIAAQGVATRGNHGGDLYAPLYLAGAALGEGVGEATELTTGTIKQLVGYVTSQDTALLIPSQYIVATTAAFSGAVSVAGVFTASATSALVGIATFSAAPVFNAGFVVPAGQAITMTKGNIIFTKGGIQRYVLVTDSAYAILLNDDILDCTLTDDRTLALPAVATAGIGKSYTVIHRSGNKVLKVVPDGAETILDYAGGTGKVTLTDNKGLDCQVTLVAIAAGLWKVTHQVGTWTSA